MRDLLRFHLPALLWALFCAAALLVPSSRLPGDDLNAGQAEAVELAIHFVLAAALALLSARSLGRFGGSLARSSAAPLLSLAYLILLEAAQQLVPGRGWGWDDIAISALGVAAAGVLAHRRRVP